MIPALLLLAFAPSLPGAPSLEPVPAPLRSGGQDVTPPAGEPGVPEADALRRALEGVDALEGLDEASKDAIRAEYEAALGALEDLAAAIRAAIRSAEGAAEADRGSDDSG